jgi:Gamma-glutamyl cyclotransferase, AIG2-like
MQRIAYFAYGTTQQGFAHHRRLRHLLGEPVARGRTVEPHAVVVPRAAACSNPACEHLHRMAVLVPWSEPLHAAGDVFLVDAAAVTALDALETGPGAPYTRTEMRVGDRTALAYVAREPERWRALVARGGADALPAYPRELAAVDTPKACCARAPGHGPPHDVVDPLALAG